MKLRLFSALTSATIFLSACGSVPTYSPVCEILDYGIIAPESENRLLKDRNDGSNRKIGKYLERPEIAETTSKIPAKLGTTFGISHVISGAPAKSKIKLVTTHPPISYDGILSTGGTRFKSIRDTGTYFTFDLPEEMALGNWTFVFEYSNIELCRQEFEVIAANE